MSQVLEKRSNKSLFPSLANYWPNLSAWSVGFNEDWQMFDELRNSLVSDLPSFPPYNIKKLGENKFEIDMAVGGFGKEDLSVELDQNQLIIEGNKESKEEDKDVDYIYKGMASQHFRQSFALANHVKVSSSDFKDGILRIKLECEHPNKVAVKS